MRIGGAQRRLIQLLKGLQNNKGIQNFLVIFSDEIDFPGLESINAEIHIIRSKKLISYRSFVEFKGILAKIKPNIVHSWQLIVSFYTTLLSFGSRFTHLNAMINDSTQRKFFNKERLLAKSIIPFADAIISNSKAGLEAYHVKLKRKAFIIHNGFDFGRLNSNATRLPESTFKGRIKDSIVVGMVARFENAKDYSTIIKAICLLLKKGLKIKFIAIGDGNTMDECKSMIPGEYKKEFFFLGKRDDVESLVPLFDIGVLSTYSEGISNAIMEYMAFKKPVVATDCPGNRELVIDGQTGLLAKSKDISDWVLKLLCLIEGRELRYAYGKNGYQHLYDQFRLSKMVDQYIELYSRLSGMSLKETR
jgi:glycosyltransferase involved in cell wall biosynthesis